MIKVLCVLLSFFIALAPALAQERNSAHKNHPVIVEKRIPAEEKNSNGTENDTDPMAIVVMPLRLLYSILPKLNNP